jgi:acetyl esterase/lipase
MLSLNPPSQIDPISLVHPELLPALEQELRESGPFTLTRANLAEVRNADWPPGEPSATPHFEQRIIHGFAGAPDVRVIVINAGAGDNPRPAVLHMHGGGFVCGSAARSVAALQRVARDHDCVVVTVEYRLAPETCFPGALEDNYTALKWVHDCADVLGVDRSRIALMGESAGAGHAAMLAIAARDRGEIPLAFQLLIYPMLDDRTGSTHHLPAHLGAFAWNPASNRFGWSALLGIPAGSPGVPDGAVPARVQVLAGLPPAYISVGSLDLFADESMEYARRLNHAGVATQLYMVPGAFHGFDHWAPESSIARDFVDHWNRALAAALR